ncbi:MAG TPA: hypothetical protein VJ386_03495, partial [Candidatus Deferrimicrobiaceae bacterium]|nr:hypothetical protein [Candidatus Deferrimicrobiaceae bacterium]
AVSDAYDAMTSDRAYRAALPARDAAAEILRCSGTQFDPEIVSIFLSVKDTIKVQRGSPAAEWLEGEVSDEDPGPVGEN